MLKPAVQAAGAGLRVADSCALALALPAAYDLYARNLSSGAALLPPISTFWPALVLALVLWGAAAWMYGLYELRTRSCIHEVSAMTKALAGVALVMLALVFLGKQQGISRLLTVIYFLIAWFLLAANRVGGRVLARVSRRRGYDARRYAVVGSNGLAREIVSAISAHPEWGLEFAGYVLEDGATRYARGPVLGRLGQLGHILEDRVIDQVIFAVPRHRLALIERAILICEDLGVEVQISLDVLRYGRSRMALHDVDGLPMIGFSRTPSDALALALKRGFDVVASALALALISPLLLGAAVAIRLDSPGPIFFRQRRVGLHGREFEMFKFRSMYQDAEARLEALRAQNEMSGPVFKMRNDPRITPVGRFLRRTSIDELPQLWNVLRGEMSIVGPRPPIPAEVRQYKRWHRRRLSVRPGITCTWQVSGRSDIDFDRWMELDLDYIDHWSLWQDFSICLRTIPAVFSARGAH